MRNLKVLVSLALSGFLVFGLTPNGNVKALEAGTQFSLKKSDEPANPALFFNPIIRQLRTYRLPLRLPSSVGDNMSGLAPEIYADTGYLAVNFVEPLPCYFCHIGRIYVNQPNETSREQLDYNRRNGASVTLREGVRGFYSRGVMAPKGYTPSLVWEQNGFIYGVSFYAGDDPENVRQYLIDMARSMARQQPVTGH
jgi:hypothetical protein